MNDDYILIYAIVPSYIYKTKELTSGEKLLAERITSLCKNKGYAWITNKALADLYGLREDTVSKNIKKLKEIGFIKCLYHKDSPNKSIRTIYLTDNVWDKQAIVSRMNKQINNGYINKHNNKSNNKVINNEGPAWLTNPELCVSTPCTPEELAELEELLSEFRGDEDE